MKEEQGDKEEKELLEIVTDRENVVKKAMELYRKGYTTLISLSAIDYPKENSFEIIVHATGYKIPREQPKVAEITIKIPRNDAWMPSLTSVWASAEFHEREAYEMFGIQFHGPPNLKRLLLDEEEFRNTYPLRKDFVVKEEPIFLEKEKRGTSA